MRTHTICLALAIVLLCPFAQSQWVDMGLLDRSIGDISVGSSGLFALTSDSGSLYRSSNGGVNWERIVPSGVGDIAVAPNGQIYIVERGAPGPVTPDSLFRSSDGGATWSNVKVVVPLSHLNVAVSPTGTVFCGIRIESKNHTRTEFATSTDGGMSWTSYDTLYGGAAFAFSGHSVINSGYAYGITGGSACLYLSPDDGQTWIFKGYPPALTSSLAWCSNGSILSGNPSWGGLSLTADSGLSWKSVSSVNPEALLLMPHSGVLLGTDTAGILLFSDNGDSMKTLNEGLTDLHVHSLVMDSAEYVYAGTNNGIWRRPLSEAVTSMPFTSGDVPGEFTLSQNYPNPFNPRTTIKFEMPKSSEVRLSVFDVLGREVSVLVNEKRNAGVHEVRFDASGLSSGVYFYRLQAGTVVETRKLLLLK